MTSVWPINDLPYARVAINVLNVSGSVTDPGCSDQAECCHSLRRPRSIDGPWDNMALHVSLCRWSCKPGCCSANLATKESCLPSECLPVLQRPLLLLISFTLMYDGDGMSAVGKAGEYHSTMEGKGLSQPSGGCSPGQSPKATQATVRQVCASSQLATPSTCSEDAARF